MESDARTFYVRAFDELPHSARETPMLPLIAFTVPIVIWAISFALVRWRSVSFWLFDPYRPELHYMRGPDPKWREKHG
jgi:hypothetical protein